MLTSARHLLPLALLTAASAASGCSQLQSNDVKVGKWEINQDSVQCETIDKTDSVTKKDCSAVRRRTVDGYYLDRDTGAMKPFTSIEEEDFTYQSIAYHCWGGARTVMHKEIEPLPELEPIEFATFDFYKVEVLTQEE